MDSSGRKKQRKTGPTVVSVASEAVPFAKTGGLGDVAGALGEELEKLGCRTILILPRYRMIPGEMVEKTELKLEIPIGRKSVKAHIWKGTTGSRTEIFLLDIPPFFDRASYYGEKGQDYPDNLARFTALSRGALELLKKLKIKPDIIHAHDWQTALIPLYLKSLYRRDPFFGKTRSLLTIHNLSYQGRFPSSHFHYTGLSKAYLSPRYLEYFGEIRLLKGGIITADWITTVSPTYEKEIRTEEFGCGLDGVIRSRRNFMSGILNGIDTELWNPATDKFIRSRYSNENFRGKNSCRRALLKEMDLPLTTGRPIISILSRLVEQKGIHQAIAAIPYLAESGTIWIIHGEGDIAYELELASLATRHPESVAIRIGYEDSLAHRIQAGSDYILMPSIFEPCGLSQMYAMRYGTVPIVRDVGGLADSVIDLKEDPLNGTGFVFHDASPQALMSSVHRALKVYRQPSGWNTLRRRIMARDFSWNRSAQLYLEAYRKVLSAPRSPVPRFNRS